MRQRRLQRHVAAARRSVIVVRLPSIDIDRRAADSRVRCHAPFDRGAVDVWLERGTSLAISLHRVVEFVSLKIVTADHGDHLAGVRIDRHHRAFDCRHLVEFDFQAMRFLIDFFDDELR